MKTAIEQIENGGPRRVEPPLFVIGVCFVIILALSTFAGYWTASNI